MSEQETQNQAGTAGNAPQPEQAPPADQAKPNLLATVLKLKAENPKLFFGAAGGLAFAIVLLLAMGGSGTATQTKVAAKELQAGGRYTLKSANAYDASATVRLVSVPGTLAAHDSAEESDRTGACQHMPQGTPVTALSFADAYGKQNAYVRVRIEEGECKGHEGWVLAIDVR